MAEERVRQLCSVNVLCRADREKVLTSGLHVMLAETLAGIKLFADLFSKSKYISDPGGIIFNNALHVTVLCGRQDCLLGSSNDGRELSKLAEVFDTARRLNA